MNTTLYLLDVFKYTLAGLIVVFAGFYVGVPYFERSKPAEPPLPDKDSQNQLLTLRLQAYERMVLFIERVNPVNLFPRLHASELSVSEMHHLIISEIRNEFHHNTTQQLYLSNQAWTVIRRIKDDTITLINTAAKSLPHDSPSLELNKSILIHLSSLEQDPYETALALIKQDIQGMF